MACPFCNPEVIAKQKIFETENENIFYNLGPKTKGHCLVAPKRHVADLRELNADELASLMQTVKLVSEKLMTHLNPVGFNYGINEGAVAGQTVFHLHFHIMPRYSDDGIKEVPIFRKGDETQFMSDVEIGELVTEFQNIF